MKPLIIFGAGASYGSERVNPKPPPLGMDLYRQLLEQNSEVWAGAKVFFEDVHFEIGWLRLRNFLEENQVGHLLRIHLVYMGIFFQSFKIDTGNIYCRLVDDISQKQWQGTIVSLNYDTLLQQALKKAEISFHIDRIVPNLESISETSYQIALLTYDLGDEDYSKILQHFGEKLLCFQSVNYEEFSLEVCLPHGNAGLTVPNLFKTTHQDSADLQGNFFVGPGESLKWIWHNELVIDSYSPIMSYYDPTKLTNYAYSYIRMQMYRYQELVQNADTIAIVGVYPSWKVDKHLWDTIQGFKGNIYYFNRNRADIELFKEWANKNDLNYAIVEKYFADGYSDLCSLVGL